MKLPARLAPLACLAGLALAAASPAAAQQLPIPTIADGHTLLTISAEGSVSSAPDMATFNAGVTTQGATAREALAENSAKMTAVIAALKSAGIADRDIQTSNLSINPVYSDPDRDAAVAARASGCVSLPPPEERIRRIIGYSVTNNVTVRQRDIANYGRVIDTLAEAGANEVNGPGFALDSPDGALDEARLAAMHTARQRAELYAQAAGLRIVQVVSITESGGYYRPQAMMARSAMAEAAAPSPPVQAGELELNAQVTVLYELAP